MAALFRRDLCLVRLTGEHGVVTVTVTVLELPPWDGKDDVVDSFIFNILNYPDF